MSQASDILKQAAQKFEELQKADPFHDGEEATKILDEAILALPEGEEKAFFARIEESIKPAEKILRDIEDGYEADSQEAIRILEEVRKGFTRDAVPKGIPGVIIKMMRCTLSQGIVAFKLFSALS